jgi:hypothetical protein
MMTWNYRVFRETDGDYVIREVFYAEDGSIVGCTANAVEPFGSTLEELAQSIEDFRAALALPILTLEDIPKSSPTLAKQKNGKTTSHEQLRIQLGLNNAQERSGAASRARDKKAP